MLIERLSYAEDESGGEKIILTVANQPIQTKEHSQLTLQEKLQKEIGKSMKRVESDKPQKTDLLSSIKKGMSLFDGGGIRGRHLEQAYQYLLSIPPTSIEAERAFLAAGYIENKIRCRLGDDTLDALLFLRVHFQNAS